MNNAQQPFPMPETPTGTLHVGNSTDVFLPSPGVAASANYDFHTHQGMLQPPFTTSSASVAEMREIVFRMAAMQPVRIDPESVKPPKRRNVRISKDPQSVVARHRRERISERIRILQRLVPGGTKMDTASMLDEAVHYMKFLKDQVLMLESTAGNNICNDCYDNVGLSSAVGFPVMMTGEGNYVGYYQTSRQSGSSPVYPEFEE